MNLTYRSNSLLSLIVSAAGLAAASTWAAPVPEPQPGDVFAGFRAEGGNGAAVSYLIKLGPDTLFRNAAEGAVIELNELGNVGADLTAVFGADWHTRVDLHWSVFASRVSVNSTVYASRARVEGKPATPWPALGQNARNATAQSIVDVLYGIDGRGYKDSEATANSPVATIQANSTNDSSYYKQVATPGTTDFGTLSQWTRIEASFGDGPSGAALDFFRISSTGTSLVGTFTIDASGVIRFTAPSDSADQDTDKDGYSDAVEAAAGTDPNNPNSFPSVIVSVVENGIRLQSNAAAANQTYRLEYSPSLQNSSWQVISTHETGAGAAKLDFVDTDAARRSAGQGFYRIRYGQ